MSFKIHVTWSFGFCPETITFLEMFDKSGDRLKNFTFVSPTKAFFIASVSSEKTGPMKVSTLSFLPFFAASTAPLDVPLVSYTLNTISFGLDTKLYLKVFRTNFPADLFSPVKGSKRPIKLLDRFFFFINRFSGI